MMEPLDPGAVEKLDDVLLGRAVSALELAADPIGLCRLVEWWSPRGKPSCDVRLAHARALIGIRQVDRAWHILRELEAEFPHRVEVKLLTARMFIDRGWGARARRIIDHLSELPRDDARVRLIVELLEQPAPSIPKQAREIARSGTPQERLKLAEQYLLSGNLLRARTVLERLAQERQEFHRVQQLLAGIDRSSQDVDQTRSQSQILDEILGWTSTGPEAPEITDVDVATEVGGLDPDTAESPGVSSLRHTVQSPVFPELFRTHGGPISLEAASDDQTQASVLASLDELPDPPTEEASLGGGMDTQIMEVISSESGVEIRPVVGEVHQPQNIRHLTESDVQDELDGDEDEDEVVIMTSREDSLSVPSASPVRREPIEVFEKVPTPPQRVSSQPSTMETIELPAVESGLDEPTVKMGAYEEDSTDRYLRQRRGRKLIGFLIPVLLIAGALGTWWWLQRQQNELQLELAENAREAIVGGDYAEMNRLALVFLEEVEQEKAPVAPRAVELALLDLFLVAEYVGQAEGAGRAQGAAGIAQEYGASSDELALIEAVSLWTAGDLEAARDALDGAGRGELQSHLKTRLELELAPGIESYPAAPMDAGSVADLVAWAIHHPQLAGVAGLDARLDEAWRSIEAESLPRLKSNLLVARARWAEVNDDGGRELADQALEVDGRNPEALLLVGEYAWAERKWSRARWAFTSCLQVKLADRRCLRGLVLVHIEMDQVEEAVALTQAWGSTIPVDISEWVRLAQLEPQEALDSSPAGAERGGVGSWRDLAGRLHILQYGLTAPPRGGDELGQLAALSSPVARSLTERAIRLETIVAMAEPPGRSDTRWEDVEDPWVYLALARVALAAGAGQRLRAREYLDRMARYSAGSARVLYERGLLLEPRHPRKAEDVWRRYLELQPSGIRATQLRERGL